jgi:hypothetical protein
MHEASGGIPPPNEHDHFTPANDGAAPAERDAKTFFASCAIIALSAVTFVLLVPFVALAWVWGVVRRDDRT